MTKEKIRVFLENLTDDDAEIVIEGLLMVRDDSYKTLLYLQRSKKKNDSLYQLETITEEKYRRSNIIIILIRQLWKNT